MIHLHVKWAFWLVMILAVFILIAHSLGAIQPPNPATEGFSEGCEGKNLPCWYGIVLEETLRRDISVLVADQHYVLQNEVFDGNARLYSNLTPSVPTQSCQLSIFYDLHNAVVDYSLKVCQGIRLGDIIELFGVNSAIGFDQSGGGTLAFSTTTFKSVFTFAGEMRPFSPITGMEIYPVAIPLTAVFSWHGFVSKQRYCQLEPDNPGCA